MEISKKLCCLNSVGITYCNPQRSDNTASNTSFAKYNSFAKQPRARRDDFSNFVVLSARATIVGPLGPIFEGESNWRPGLKKLHLTLMVYCELFLLSITTVIENRTGKTRSLWILARLPTKSQSFSSQFLSVMLHDPYSLISFLRGSPLSLSISSRSIQES